MAGLGAKIRALRLERGLTQQELAAGLCDRSFLSLVEHGRASPSADFLLRLAARLGVAPGLLADQETGWRERREVQRLLAEAERALGRGGTQAAADSYQRAASRAEALSLVALAAKAYEGLAEVQLRQRAPGAAVGSADRAAHFYRAAQDHVGLARCYQIRGRCHFEMDVFEEALRCFRRALELLENRHGSAALRARVLVNIANSYYRLGEYDRLLEAAQAAVAYARSVRQYFWFATALTAAGLAHRHLGRPDEARQAFKEARRIYAQVRYEAGVYNCTHNLALVETDRGNWRHALGEFERCRQYYRHHCLGRELAAAMHEIARARLALGQADLARAACEEGLSALPVGERLVTRGRLYETLADAWAADGEPALAAAYRTLSEELQAAAARNGGRRSEGAAASQRAAAT